MFRYVFRRFAKIALYALGICAAIGAWDFLQQTQVAEGDFSLQDYATSVSERYGDQASAFASSAVGVAHSGMDNGLVWVKSSGLMDHASGLLEKAGLNLAVSETVNEPQTQTVAAPATVTTLDDLVVLASADKALAPQTSLFPRARVAR